MKRLLLFGLLMLAMCSVNAMGDTIPWPWDTTDENYRFVQENPIDTVCYGDPYYLFQPIYGIVDWVDDPGFYWSLQLVCPVVKEYVVPAGVDSLYGIAATIMVRTKNMDSIRVVLCAYRKLKEGFELVDTVDFSNYYAVSALEYQTFEAVWSSDSSAMVGITDRCHFYYPTCYEFYFDHPYSISDTIYVGVHALHISSSIREGAPGLSVAFIGGSDWDTTNSLHGWYVYNRITDTYLSVFSERCGVVYPIVQPDRLDKRVLQGLEVTELGDDYAALRWESHDTLRQQLSIAPWNAEPDSHIVATLYGTDTVVPGLDSGIYYAARVRSERHHVCPLHDTLYWSRWSSPVLFYLGSTEPDTTAFINGNDMVGRYVTVQPNPAVEEARVLSSFGLERIEAYDDRGRLVAEVAAKGYEATLDVKAWTSGTYLLRITTPMGTVTKKLLVQ